MGFGLEAGEGVAKRVGKQVIDGLERANLIEPDTPDYSQYDYGPYTSDYVRYLRPPGAMSEWEMTDMCSRCGLCANACPADAIKLDEETAGGVPHIVARQQPCVVCDDLSCMKVCPTGALTLVEDKKDIRMGTAMVDQHTCVRSDWREDRDPEDCRICMEICPYGEDAIGLDYHEQIEVREGCTGCGLCEWKCPTEPASIWVEESYDSMHDHWHDYDHDDSYDHAYHPALTMNRARLKRHKRIRERHSMRRRRLSFGPR